MQIDNVLESPDIKPKAFPHEIKKGSYAGVVQTIGPVIFGMWEEKPFAYKENLVLLSQILQYLNQDFTVKIPESYQSTIDQTITFYPDVGRAASIHFLKKYISLVKDEYIQFLEISILPETEKAKAVEQYVAGRMANAKIDDRKVTDDFVLLQLEKEFRKTRNILHTKSLSAENQIELAQYVEDNKSLFVDTLKLGEKLRVETAVRIIKEPENRQKITDELKEIRVAQFKELQVLHEKAVANHRINRVVQIEKSLIVKENLLSKENATKYFNAPEINVMDNLLSATKSNAKVHMRAIIDLAKSNNALAALGKIKHEKLKLLYEDDCIYKLLKNKVITLELLEEIKLNELNTLKTEVEQVHSFFKFLPIASLIFSNSIQARLLNLFKDKKNIDILKLVYLNNLSKYKGSLDNKSITILTNYLDALDLSDLPKEKLQEALFKAVKSSNEQMVEILLRNKADANSRDKNNATPIFYAVGRKSGKIIDLLINANANLNAYSTGHLTPLHIAAAADKSYAIKTLLEHGAKADTVTSAGKAIDYSENDNSDTRPLLKVAVLKDVNEKDTDGKAFIHRGSYSEQVLDYMLFRKADLNLKDKDGNAALHLLSNKNNVDGVKSLLNKGANPNLFSNKKATPLHFAVHRNNIELVKLLLKFNADYNLSINNSKSPLKLAEELKRDEIVKLFKEREPMSSVQSPVSATIASAETTVTKT